MASSSKGLRTGARRAEDEDAEVTMLDWRPFPGDPESARIGLNN